MKYAIIHVLPGKQEVKVREVDTMKQVGAVVDTAKYAGTWLTPTRKLLRFGRGFIEIREIDAYVEPKIVECREISMGPFAKVFELEVAHGNELKCILLHERIIVGYRKFYYESENEDVLWKVTSFNALSDIVGKEIAYQTMQHYHRYCRVYNLEEVM